MATAGRFIFPGKYAMRVLDNKKKGTLLAYFDVVDTKIGLEFRDLRLIEGRSGTFVGPPFREYENDDGETKYVNYWGAAYDFDAEERNEKGMAYMDEMAEAAMAEYERQSSKGKKPSRKPTRAADEDDDEDEAPPRRTAAKRKPVARDEDDDEGDEEEAPPRAKKKAAAPAKGKSARGPLPRADESDEDADDYDDDDEDADPPEVTRKPARKPAAAPAAAKKRRPPF